MLSNSSLFTDVVIFQIDEALEELGSLNDESVEEDYPQNGIVGQRLEHYLPEDDQRPPADLHNAPAYPQVTSTPFQSNFDNDVDEATVLYGQGGYSREKLENLFRARGVEISRLRQEITHISSVQAGEPRLLQHQLALAKAENEKLSVKLEDQQTLAQTQSQENQALRREMDQLKMKLRSMEEEKAKFCDRINSSDLMIQTLQSQLMDYQKSDTILKAKKQHEETVRSLKDRHDKEVFSIQQEVDRLTSLNKRLVSSIWCPGCQP